MDTAAKLTSAMIEQVKKRGYSCLIRYVPHVGSIGAHDIDVAELNEILDSGLALMLVQHVRVPGWVPSNGGFDGERAAEWAKRCGYAQGAHIFVDLEGIAGTRAVTREYAEDWARCVKAAGYAAGAYVGYAVPLNAADLYALRGINSYWSDLGPRQVETRGFAMKQHTQIVIGGLPFDPDTIQLDAKGETPIWMRDVP
ncbi:MAG TPA: glycoside hydrolase domain-containing protein [Polyangiaceae bacterium]|nr:glycoside hydrolase domain-containing protein [Polyangiaceae bacterium]